MQSCSEKKPQAASISVVLNNLQSADYCILMCLQIVRILKSNVQFQKLYIYTAF
jgi:hypothetical protein